MLIGLAQKARTTSLAEFPAVLERILFGRSQASANRLNQLPPPARSIALRRRMVGVPIVTKFADLRKVPVQMGLTERDVFVAVPCLQKTFAPAQFVSVGIADDAARDRA